METPVWRTFYGKDVRFSDMTHQHLSNVIWYYKLVCKSEPHVEILNELKERFGGFLLPYVPLTSFTEEIQYLIRHGYTTGHHKADIIVDGVWVGKIKYGSYE